MKDYQCHDSEKQSISMSLFSDNKGMGGGGKK
jgi:hypothetical protein